MPLTLQLRWVLPLTLLGSLAHAGDAAPTDANSSEPTSHWSLQALRLPQLPHPANPRWVQTPVDAFVLDRLQQSGMRPAAPASKRALLRRVSYDLTGLPPTPEEARAFESDRSPDAFPRIVERLLSSPRYGERWARHWLDIVHYADTHGHDQDRLRTNAWPYRDYVIDAFNTDKPYVQFVREQIAGDTFYPNDPMATVAMGFLAAGPWDESSLRDIQEDTVDRRIARYIDRDDIVTTTLSTFASSTVHCARCHAHKFDPIPQEDYYDLQAVFAATDKANRYFDPDPALHQQRQQLLRQRRGALTPAERADFAARQAAWEQTTQASLASWLVLEPLSFTTTNASQLALQPDQSLLATGARPERDVYTILTQPQVETIRAIRLEALTDPSLPLNGPGRQDNGNFHLNEFAVFAPDTPNTTNSSLSPANPALEPALPPRLHLARAIADFDQPGWEAPKAIDGKTNTAWGIHPQVGKNHHIVFELQHPLRLDPKTNSLLRFVLHQTHGAGHLLGRFRLAVSADPQAAQDAADLPPSLAAVLSQPALSRTAADQETLAEFFRTRETDRALARLPAPHLVYAGASDFPPDAGFKPAHAPRPVHLLRRGDIHQPRQEAVPGALACVTMLPAKFELATDASEGERRAALARWLTHAQHPLTWRSIVNRVWQYHFGRGLVDTPNDFGRMGSRPSHPELLDWLAVTFRDSGGSIKHLHRLILLSATYQQATQDQPAYRSLDADNRQLWRMNRLRLDAEAVRDTAVALAGDMDLRMGGPSVHQFILSAGVHVTPVVDYDGFDLRAPANYRRSVYRTVFRTLPDPLMDSLDCADASQLTPARNTSVTVLQALALLNNRLLLAQSERIAQRIQRTTPSPDGQLVLAFELALSRPPTPEETCQLSPYLREHGLANLCRLLLNTNEMMFLN
jgi:hypothetical protein